MSRLPRFKAKCRRIIGFGFAAEVVCAKSLALNFLTGKDCAFMYSRFDACPLIPTIFLLIDSAYRMLKYRGTLFTINFNLKKD